MLVEYDGFGCIDGRASANGDNHVGLDLIEQLETLPNPCDGGVLPNFVERRSVRIVTFEDILNGMVEVGLQNAQLKIFSLNEACVGL